MRYKGKMFLDTFPGNILYAMVAIPTGIGREVTPVTDPCNQSQQAVFGGPALCECIGCVSANNCESLSS